ncbi:MAG: S8 family serine peptidase [Acidobacteria bacterium]|nr:S8 family serine peptidase [Acidobacteriota bacterium]
MRPIRRLCPAIFSLFLCGGFFALAVSGQNVPNGGPSAGLFEMAIRNRAVSAAKYDDSPAVRLRQKISELKAKTGSSGSVAVIVRLKIENYRLDALLDERAQAIQRQAIREKQSSLLASLSAGADDVKRFEFLPFLAMQVTSDALNALGESNEIDDIQESEWQRPLLLESIPLIGGSPFGGANGGTFGGFSGLGRTVAVLDTGVDKTHPFFNNRVVSEACYSTNSATNTSYCPGGANSSTASGSGLNCNVSVIDDCFHGTHVAGIAAGGNPAVSGNGVARNANIIAIQVFSRSTDCGGGASPCNRSSTGDTILGLERVYALRTTFNIDAVNLSLGGGQYFSNCDTEQSLYKEAIDNLRAAGIATVAASGNSGYTNSLSSPACVSSAISVGSTHDGSAGFPDVVSDFSNSALFLNLLAPGELILSAYPGGLYQNTQGTSQAAPHVAGAWAVIRQKFPTDTVTQVLNRIKYSGPVILDPENGIGKPRLKLDTALNTSNAEPCDSSVAINFGQTINSSIAAGDCLLISGSRADRFSFTATQGQQIAITQTSTAFDSFLLLYNSAGANIAFDNNGGGGVNSRIPATSGFFTIPATGTYYIYASSLTLGAGAYSVSLINGGGCSFTINSSSQNFPAAGGNGSFNVTTASGCGWTAQSNSGWLTTSSTGSGNGAVNYVVAPNASPSQRIGTITAGGQTHTVTQAGAAAATARAPFDFDGDNKSDLSIFRPSVGEWWYLKSSNGGNAAAQFGASTDRITPGDFTGDQKSDFAFFRPSTGQWYIMRSENFTFYAFPFGASTDIVAPADYDGDGKTDAAVFRPSNGTWYIQKSGGGTDIIGFGASGDKPAFADYDGDGKADLAIFRPSNGQWWIRRSSNATVFAVTSGLSTDRSVPGDFTGDGKADIAIFRPSNGIWYVLRSEDFSFYSFPFGANGDVPVVGDYDGDGRRDAAVFRPGNGTWYINRSTAGTLIQAFGVGTDQPAPSAFLP